MAAELRELDPTLLARDALVEIGQDDRIAFHEDGETFVVYRSDLQKMVAMGLSDLPIESIGVPAESPILHTQNLELRHTLDISNKLTEYFPGYLVAALYEMQSLVKKGEFSAYVIGGNVRDILLHKGRLLDIRDVDLTIEGDAISSSQFIVANSKNFVVDECFPEFGTVKIRYKENIQFDLASTRKEIYRSCSALPEVVETGVTLSDDIIRRDFTCNALALSIHDLGQILDHSNGIEDIEKRVIRVLHPLSFFEDPSRILRALKFAARLEFKLTEATERLIHQFLKHGDKVYNGGGERIKHELKQLLSGEENPTKQHWCQFFVDVQGLRLANMAIASHEPSEALKNRLDSVLARHPFLEETLGAVMKPDEFLWELYLCFLFEELDADVFAETAHRLGLTKSEREIVEKYSQLVGDHRLDDIHEFSPPEDIYDVFKDLPPASVVAVAMRSYTDEPARFKIVVQALKTYKTKFEQVRPELNGNDLQELGVPEGEMIGELLKELLHAKLSGRLKDRMSEVRYIQHKLESDPEEAHEDQEKPEEDGDELPPAH